MKHVIVGVKIIVRVTKIVVGIPTHVKRTIANDSKFVWDQSIFAMDIVATYVTNTVPTNVSSTVSTNYHKKARYKMNCYILHTVLLVTKVLLIIAIICYHYANHGSKVKNILSC